MSARPSFARVRLGLMVFLAAAVAVYVAGCVVVPYSPRTESQSAPVRLESADKVLLTIGPRELLEDTRKSLRRRDKGFEIVDSLAFRNAAFPEGDWRLSRLLEPSPHAPITPFGADYLLVVGQVRTGEADEHGGMFLTPYGVWGAHWGTSGASAVVLIVDLARGKILDAVKTHAEGADAGLGIVVGLFIHATTESSVRRAYIDSMIATIRAVRPSGRVRVALMAAEPIDSSNSPLSLIAE